MKKKADKSYSIDIYDIDSLLKLCREEKVDGVISASLDPCQKPYAELCEKAGYVSYGTKEQFHVMTNKRAFKQMCIENNVDIVRSFDFNGRELYDKKNYPVIVKPVDSRGSRGQTICNSMGELEDAIKAAKRDSSNGDYIIEKYIKDGSFFQVTYFCINGNPYLIRTADGYCGSDKYGLEKVISCAISPSRYTDCFIDTVHKNIVKMIQSLGIVNGPVFMQGIVHKEKFYFFDPGLRFPGVDYEKIYKEVYGVDLMKAMVRMALNDNCLNINIPKDGVWLNGKRAAILFPFLQPGIIGRIYNEDKISEDGRVISYLPRYREGDQVAETFDVNRRQSEIDILADSMEDLKEKIAYIQTLLKVDDMYGRDMICDKFQVSRIIGEEYYA